MDHPVFDSQQWQKVFLFSKTQSLVQGPTNLLVNWCQVLFHRRYSSQGVNHPPSLIAEAKNEWSYTSAPPVCLHGRHGGVITFTFTSCS